MAPYHRITSSNSSSSNNNTMAGHLHSRPTSSSSSINSLVGSSSRAGMDRHLNPAWSAESHVLHHAAAATQVKRSVAHYSLSRVALLAAACCTDDCSGECKDAMGQPTTASCLNAPCQSDFCGVIRSITGVAAAADRCCAMCCCRMKRSTTCGRAKASQAQPNSRSVKQSRTYVTNDNNSNNSNSNHHRAATAHSLHNSRLIPIVLTRPSLHIHSIHHPSPYHPTHTTPPTATIVITATITTMSITTPTTTTTAAAAVTATTASRRRSRPVLLCQPVLHCPLHSSNQHSS